MPLVTIDTKELRELAQEMKASDLLMVARARKAVKKVSFALEKRIKHEMPWLTGRARVLGSLVGRHAQPGCVRGRFGLS